MILVHGVLYRNDIIPSIRLDYTHTVRKKDRNRQKNRNRDRDEDSTKMINLIEYKWWQMTCPMLIIFPFWLKIVVDMVKYNCQIERMNVFGNW